MSTAKYDPQAGSWTEDAYADPSGYLARRADLIVSLGPQLEVGDTVIDLACGDAGLAEPLLARGLHYVGVDLSAPMVEAARSRVAERAEIVLADLNDYRPPRSCRLHDAASAPSTTRTTAASSLPTSLTTRSGSSSSTSIRASTASRMWSPI